IGPENHVIHAAHEAPNWVKVSPFIAMVLGFALAWLFYIKRTDLPGRLATQQRPLYLFLLNKWYFDELYNLVFVRPAFGLGRLFWKQGDIGIIDRFGPNGSAAVVALGSRLAARMQTGYLYSYALVMLLGLVAAVSWMMVQAK
ncbi:MAG: NADH-quinone oxidoreductase subunit L, partial [Sphingorhabdus sp.]